MRTAGIREARQNLSALLDEVKKGREVVITERGRPVAKLVPADNPAVTGAMRVRFYAGRPVRIDGHRVGTLCVADHRPRELRQEDLSPLEDLAALVEQELAADARRPARNTR